MQESFQGFIMAIRKRLFAFANTNWQPSDTVR